jgi:hypothetical protein
MRTLPIGREGTGVAGLGSPGPDFRWPDSMFRPLPATEPACFKRPPQEPQGVDATQPPSIQKRHSHFKGGV